MYSHYLYGPPLSAHAPLSAAKLDLLGAPVRTRGTSSWRGRRRRPLEAQAQVGEAQPARLALAAARAVGVGVGAAERRAAEELLAPLQLEDLLVDLVGAGLGCWGVGLGQGLGVGCGVGVG